MFIQVSGKTSFLAQLAPGCLSKVLSGVSAHCVEGPLGLNRDYVKWMQVRNNLPLSPGLLYGLSDPQFPRL